MIEEEKLAEEYAIENWEYYEEGQTDYKALKQAYLAGLSAGRSKWHKVADGDLPKDENDVLVYSGEDWRMCVGKYSPKYKAWETGCDTIAWCEIPTYTDE